MNHLYWSAASTSGYDGDMIVAKWSSVNNHVMNQHEGHGELFPDCLHEPLSGREATKEWIKPRKYSIDSLGYHLNVLSCLDSAAAVRFEKLVLDKNLLSSIRNLSGKYQTSNVEAFHSLIIHFAPKLTVFSYSGMLARFVHG